MGCYIDDIIIAGITLAEHVACIEEVLQHLLRHGIHTKLLKCQFLQPIVLSFSDTVSIPTEFIHSKETFKLKAILQAPALTNVQMTLIIKFNADPKVFNISQIEALLVTVRQLRAGTSSDRVLSGKVYRYTIGVWPHQVPANLRPFFNRRNELMVEESCLL